MHQLKITKLDRKLDESIRTNYFCLFLQNVKKKYNVTHIVFVFDHNLWLKLQLLFIDSVTECSFGKKIIVQKYTSKDGGLVNLST